MRGYTYPDKWCACVHVTGGTQNDHGETIVLKLIIALQPPLKPSFMIAVYQADTVLNITVKQWCRDDMLPLCWLNSCVLFAECGGLSAAPQGAG